MVTYRYSARTAEGEVAVGSVEASNPDEALDLILSRGLVDVQIIVSVRSAQPEGAVSDEPPYPRLTPDEATELTQHVAQLSTAQIPLAMGLEAAADESSSIRVASTLRWIAHEASRGRSLEDILTQSGNMLPRHICGLVLAAVRTGTLGEALFELVEHQQRARSLRQEIGNGFVYPLVVAVFAGVVLLFVTYFVTGMIEAMLIEFELELPVISRALFWFKDTGLPILVAGLLVLLLVAAIYRLLGGRASWRRFLSSIPLIGPLWTWSGVAEWASLMSVLLRHEICLPDALRLSAYGTRDERIGDVSRQLADGVVRGRNLVDLMRADCRVPATLVPLVDWGQKSSVIAESFRVGSEAFQRRVQTRAVLVSSIVPPLLFVGIGACTMFVVIGSFGPLFSLISHLS